MARRSRKLLTHEYTTSRRRKASRALAVGRDKEMKPFPMPMVKLSDLPEGFRKQKARGAKRTASEQVAPTRTEGKPPGTSLAASSGFEAETELVENFDEYPFSAVGKMFFVGGRSTFVGTGWIVGRRAFATAAHCLFDRDSNDFYDNITFIPGHDGSGAGTQFSVVESTIHSNYASRRADHLRWDIGVAIVEEDLVSQFGSIGYDATGVIDDDEMVDAIGYPASSRPLAPANNGGAIDFEDHPFDGSEMWYSLGEYLGASNDQHSMANEMTGGCSGGPWLQDETVAVGLNSFRLVPHDNRMFSPILDEDFLELITWLIENDAF